MTDSFPTTNYGNSAERDEQPQLCSCSAQLSDPTEQTSTSKVDWVNGIFIFTGLMALLDVSKYDELFKKKFKLQFFKFSNFSVSVHNTSQ